MYHRLLVESACTKLCLIAGSMSHEDLKRATMHHHAMQLVGRQIFIIQAMLENSSAAEITVKSECLRLLKAYRHRETSGRINVILLL